MKDLISIVVPAYNSEKYIERCIRSILNQTHKNIQLIIVNDGSTDSTASICRKYESKDSRILFIDKPNGGVSSARNAGVAASQGEYVGFVDSDDFIEATMYEKLLQLITQDNSQCATILNQTIRPPRKEILEKKSPITQEEALISLFELRMPTSLWAYLYKKKTIDGILLDESIHFFEDFEFNFRALTRCSRISTCKDSLYNYEINESSINSQNLSEKVLSCLSIHKKISPTINSINIEKITERSIFYRSHFLISIISRLEKKDGAPGCIFQEVVKKESRDILLKSLKSKHLPAKYKAAIAATAISPTIITRIIKPFIKALKSRKSGS